MLTAVQRLKVALMTEGLEVSSLARDAIVSDEPSGLLTLADYATTSGIALRLEPNVWVNAPIKEYNPNFVVTPPHSLEYDTGMSTFFVRSGTFEVQAKPISLPNYHNRINQWGEKYTSYSITHTDRVRASPIEGCALTCQFCDLPFKLPYRKKPIERLIDSVSVALNDLRLPARHILVSGGSPRPEDRDYEKDVYAQLCRSFPYVDIDIMMIPAPSLLDLPSLLAMGIHELSINLEIFNDGFARRLMPGKWKLGKSQYFELIDRAVETFGAGRVRSLLIVGLEPLEDTLRGVEALAQRGCEPVLSPFRPDPSTPLRHHSPPTISQLIELYERSIEIATRYAVRLGPKCVPCQHNTLTFADDSGYYVETDA